MATATRVDQLLRVGNHSGERATVLVVVWAYARARVLKDPTPGQIVYYFRRNDKVGHKGAGDYYGPARVLMVEPPEVDKLSSSIPRC